MPCFYNLVCYVAKGSEHKNSSEGRVNEGKASCSLLVAYDCQLEAMLDSDHSLADQNEYK